MFYVTARKRHTYWVQGEERHRDTILHTGELYATRGAAERDARAMRGEKGIVNVEVGQFMRRRNKGRGRMGAHRMG